MSDGMSSAGISAKERLARIETVLDKIDRKLDHKADKADVVALEVRVRAIEDDAHEHVRHPEMKDVHNDIGAVKQRLAMYAGGLGVLSVVVNFTAPLVHK